MARGHAAIWTLVAVPEKTLRLLEERLKPAEPADPQRIRRLLTDLDSPKFSVREAASREVEQMASQPEPVERLLREALQKRPSLESRRRIEAILSLPQVARNPEYVRRIRANQALEQIGTPEAQQILKRLASGAAADRETQEAKASLERLAKRP